MTFPIDQILLDAMQEVGIFEDVVNKIRALPPVGTRHLVDYAPVLGLDPAGDLYKQLAMIDTIEAQLKAANPPAPAPPGVGGGGTPGGAAGGPGGKPLK